MPESETDYPLKKKPTDWDNVSLTAIVELEMMKEDLEHRMIDDLQRFGRLLNLETKVIGRDHSAFSGEIGEFISLLTKEAEECENEDDVSFTSLPISDPNEIYDYWDISTGTLVWDPPRPKTRQKTAETAETAKNQPNIDDDRRPSVPCRVSVCPTLSSIAEEDESLANDETETHKTESAKETGRKKKVKKAKSQDIGQRGIGHQMHTLSQSCGDLHTASTQINFEEREQKKDKRNKQQNVSPSLESNGTKTSKRRKTKSTLHHTRKESDNGYGLSTVPSVPGKIKAFASLLVSRVIADTLHAAKRMLQQETGNGNLIAQESANALTEDVHILSEEGSIAGGLQVDTSAEDKQSAHEDVIEQHDVEVSEQNTSTTDMPVGENIETTCRGVVEQHDVQIPKENIDNTSHADTSVGENSEESKTTHRGVVEKHDVQMPEDSTLTSVSEERETTCEEEDKEKEMNSSCDVKTEPSDDMCALPRAPTAIKRYSSWLVSTAIAEALQNGTQTTHPENQQTGSSHDQREPDENSYTSGSSVTLYERSDSAIVESQSQPKFEVNVPYCCTETTPESSLSLSELSLSKETVTIMPSLDVVELSDRQLTSPSCRHSQACTDSNSGIKINESGKLETKSAPTLGLSSNELPCTTLGGGSLAASQKLTVSGPTLHLPDTAKQIQTFGSDAKQCMEQEAAAITVTEEASQETSFATGITNKLEKLLTEVVDFRGGNSTASSKIEGGSEMLPVGLKAGSKVTDSDTHNQSLVEEVARNVSSSPPKEENTRKRLAENYSRCQCSKPDTESLSLNPIHQSALSDVDQKNELTKKVSRKGRRKPISKSNDSVGTKNSSEPSFGHPHRMDKTSNQSCDSFSNKNDYVYSGPCLVGEGEILTTSADVERHWSKTKQPAILKANSLSPSRNFQKAVLSVKSSIGGSILPSKLTSKSMPSVGGRKTKVVSKHAAASQHKNSVETLSTSRATRASGSFISPADSMSTQVKETHSVPCRKLSRKKSIREPCVTTDSSYSSSKPMKRAGAQFPATNDKEVIRSCSKVAATQKSQSSEAAQEETLDRKQTKADIQKKVSQEETTIQGRKEKFISLSTPQVYSQISTEPNKLSETKAAKAASFPRTSDGEGLDATAWIRANRDQVLAEAELREAQYNSPPTATPDNGTSSMMGPTIFLPFMPALTQNSNQENMQHLTVLAPQQGNILGQNMGRSRSDAPHSQCLLTQQETLSLPQLLCASYGEAKHNSVLSEAMPTANTQSYSMRTCKNNTTDYIAGGGGGVHYNLFGSAGVTKPPVRGTQSAMQYPSVQKRAQSQTFSLPKLTPTGDGQGYDATAWLTANCHQMKQSSTQSDKNHFRSSEPSITEAVKMASNPIEDARCALQGKNPRRCVSSVETEHHPFDPCGDTRAIAFLKKCESEYEQAKVSQGAKPGTLSLPKLQLTSEGHGYDASAWIRENRHLVLENKTADNPTIRVKKNDGSSCKLPSIVEKKKSYLPGLLNSVPHFN